MRNIIVNPGIQHYHDDQFSDDRIKIYEFPYMRVFGDFRIFNGLPIDLVDEKIGQIKEIMVEIQQAHADYHDYWETHPNTDTGTLVDKRVLSSPRSTTE